MYASSFRVDKVCLRSASSDVAVIEASSGTVKCTPIQEALRSGWRSYDEGDVNKLKKKREENIN